MAGGASDLIGHQSAMDLSLGIFAHLRVDGLGGEVLFLDGYFPIPSGGHRLNQGNTDQWSAGVLRPGLRVLAGLNASGLEVRA